ncbi:MAG: hypothetical protein Ct9H90mP11_00340 [Acidimicrobiales bacterium]|nr:MAG: hypothetical protein Ct9H90mP11_00340 [Acidimicrobiales bacterium]
MQNPRLTTEDLISTITSIMTEKLNEAALKGKNLLLMKLLQKLAIFKKEPSKW